MFCFYTAEFVKQTFPPWYLDQSIVNFRGVKIKMLNLAASSTEPIRTLQMYWTTWLYTSGGLYYHSTENVKNCYLRNM